MLYFFTSRFVCNDTHKNLVHCLAYVIYIRMCIIYFTNDFNNFFFSSSFQREDLASSENKCPNLLLKMIASHKL
jgi:hypothetical protein